MGKRLVVQAPCLTIAGTTADELFEQYDHAVNAARDARDKIAECWPHPRDYGAQTYKLAKAEYDRRLKMITQLVSELEAVRYGITSEESSVEVVLCDL